MPMASTTKIMTCIVALESGKMNQIIKVSSKAVSMPKVKMYAKLLTFKKFIVMHIIKQTHINIFPE